MLPLFSFPTKVVLVDDDPDFLNDLEVFLDKDTASYLTFNSAKKGLDFLNDEATFLSDSNYVLEDQDSYEWGKQSFFLNFDNIKNIALEPSRVDQLSIVIVDYNMPGMDGLELLKSINNSMVKKILLTGEADEATAIEAFNKGLIDKFIRKQDPDLISKVNDAISELQRAAFVDISSEIMPAKYLANNNPIYKNAPKLEAFFYDTLNAHNIVEFYLVDSQGSFLLIDKDRNTKGFFVRTEDQVRAFEEEILGEAEIDQTVINSILDRSKIVCYVPKKDKVIPENDELGKYLRSAHKFEGKQEPYYAAYLETFPFFEDFKIS